MPSETTGIFESMDFDKVKDHPNILIAASLWEKDRFEAASVCYRYLRTIDDLIDCHKSIHAAIPDHEKHIFRKRVQEWIDSIREPAAQENGKNDELLQTMSKYHIPLWPMEDFSRSMMYDIDHTGFNTLDDFLDYSLGASVAPASIFVHLCGVRKGNNGYLPPEFDVRKASKPCAIFSYIVHIIRDFHKDQANNLNCFALDVLKRHRLDEEKIREIAETGLYTTEFRNMMQEYYDRADVYRRKTYDIINEIKDGLEPRYYASLRVIFSLYLMVFERINCASGSFSTEALNPTPDELKKRLFQTLDKMPE
jgi:phytoene/squalene synthetase